MTRVPFNDLTRLMARHRHEVNAAVARVVASGRFVLGEEVDGFEREFAANCGAGFCVGLASGTDALELALRALGIGDGARVGVAANAGTYGTLAALAVGAQPVFVDVDATTANISPDSLAEALDKGLDAIVVTHLYGRMANMPAISALVQSAGIPLIEDCAQAHGATIAGRKAGTWGDAGCFSFYPTKNLGALGDAGAVVTADGELAGRIRRLRQYGWGEKYVIESEGGRNSRLDEMQAAILRVMLADLDRRNEERRQIAKTYDEAFAALPGNRMAPRGESDDVCHLYVITSEDRDALAGRLGEAGVDTAIHYPIADCCQAALRAHAPAHRGELPATHRLCEQVLSLPCFPGLTAEEQQRVIGAVTANAA